MSASLGRGVIDSLHRWEMWAISSHVPERRRYPEVSNQGTLRWFRSTISLAEPKPDDSITLLIIYRHPLTPEKCAPHSRSHWLLTAATSQGRKGQVPITTPQNLGAFLRSKNFISKPFCYLQLIQTSQSFSPWIILQQFFFLNLPRFRKTDKHPDSLSALHGLQKKKKRQKKAKKIQQSSRDFFTSAFFTSVVDDSSIFLRF